MAQDTGLQAEASHKAVSTSRRKYRWLVRRPIWLTTVVIFGVFVAFTYVLWQRLSTSNDDYRDQLLRMGLGKRFVEAIHVELGKHPEMPASAFHLASRKLCEAYPEVSPYILDERGQIVLDLALDSRSWLQSVDLQPIAAWLQDRNLHAGVIYGDNPGDPKRRAPFSVEPLTVGTFKGYAYVLLRNPSYRLMQVPFRERGDWQNTFLLILGGSTAGIFLFSMLVNFVVDKLFRNVNAMVVQLAPDIPRDEGADSEMIDQQAYEQSIVSLISTIASERMELKEQQETAKQTVSRVLHDLRTPLFLIQSYAERLLAADDALPAEEQKREAGRIRRNVKSLVSLLSDLEEFDRMRGRATELTVELCYLDELAFDLASMYEVQAEAGKVELSVEAEPNLPGISVDTALIERALRNLLDNALRHTPPGGKVVMRLERRREDGIRISVVDTGCGIPQSELGQIFEPFLQVRSTGCKNGIAGLGLAIVEQIVEAHGSKIFVESQEHQGTRFWFDLAPRGTDLPPGAER